MRRQQTTTTTRNHREILCQEIYDRVTLACPVDALTQFPGAEESIFLSLSFSTMATKASLSLDRPTNFDPPEMQTD